MRKICLAVLPLAMLAAGCHRKPKGDETATVTNVTAPVNTTSPAAPAAVPVPADFSIDNVPISNAPLGKFPFFGWPANYQAQNTPKEIGFGHFPFCTGKAFKDVEGQTFMVTLDAAPNKQFSSYELQKNMHTLFQQAGAVKVYEGKIPNNMIMALPDTVRGEIAPSALSVRLC